MCRINCNLHLLVGILLSSVGVTFAGGDLPAARAQGPAPQKSVPRPRQS